VGVRSVDYREESAEEFMWAMGRGIYRRWRPWGSRSEAKTGLGSGNDGGLWRFSPLCNASSDDAGSVSGRKY